MAFERASGILLHPTSLPGSGGIGVLGAEARAWVDFLAAAGQRLWQVMPLGPTGYGDSPYQSFSAFAGNPYLIDLTELVAEGWLTEDDLAPFTALPREKVDFGPLIRLKVEVLTRAAANAAAATARGVTDPAYDEFVATHGPSWLDDYARFMAIKESVGGGSWSDWPRALRHREPAALAAALAGQQPAVQRHTLWQYWFFRQWQAVRAYANARGVSIVGDVPIFVSLDSADTWSNPELFHFDEPGRPSVVAGVPPDYFSATGQRWGNPLYRWDVMSETGYAWWIERMRATLSLVDIVRVDHFRGFAAYWEIPASEPTAIKGRWVKAPGSELFQALRAAFPELPVIAEDLGVITPDVEELRDSFGLPGMKVLQFAFGGGPDDPYLPHTYDKNCVVYSGTHDNDTTLGWYGHAPEIERDFARRYLGRGDENIAWEFVRLALASTANTAIVPLQDVIGLGQEGRMNTPGQPAGNWSWRFTWDMVPYWVAPQLRELAEVYGRLGGAGPTDTAYRQSTLAK
ncbi:MAG TPA: 4-alpha-glucanotransferase [Trueperaceae bacterium]|nr:4-alpha-glucanotransferase [Trueperaceae bacterium]